MTYYIHLVWMIILFMTEAMFGVALVFSCYYLSNNNFLAIWWMGVAILLRLNAMYLASKYEVFLTK